MIRALVFTSTFLALGCGSSHSPGGDAGSGSDSGSGTSCSDHSDCSGSEHCSWEPGCGTGTCTNEACTRDISPYTMCDGTCATGSSNCAPGPFLARGCAPDGGVACGGFAEAECPPDQWCDFPEASACGGDDSLGVCRPRPNACTLLLDPVCGCDGATHGNECGANTAGVDIAHRGECGTPPPLADCTATMPCVGGGICVGEGCGTRWTCQFLRIACTDDEAPFCGCDGNTFFDSSTCPRRPFAFRGSCESGADCDQRFVLCDALPPPCPEGQVPSVEGGCWGACVPVGTCVCENSDQCPGSELLCDPVGGRCVIAAVPG